MTGGFSLDTQGFYCGNTAYFFPTGDNYIFGLLNSSLLLFYYQQIASSIRGGFFRYFTQNVKTIPLQVIDENNPEDKNPHDQITSLAGTMLDLNEQLAGSGLPHLKKTIKRQIEATDRQINSLVYRLYELTEDEINIIENN